MQYVNSWRFPLFVVGHNGFEKIAEAFVAALVVLACHLQEKTFEHVETAQAVAGDRISKSGAQHDELMLAFTLDRAAGAANGVIEAPELALGTGIHVAQAGHNGVCLIVEVKRVYDELFEVDIRGKVAEALRAAIATGPRPTVATTAAISFGSRPTGTAVSLGTTVSLGTITYRATVTLRRSGSLRTSTLRGARAWGTTTLRTVTLRTVTLRTVTLRTTGSRRISLWRRTRRLFLFGLRCFRGRGFLIDYYFFFRHACVLALSVDRDSG